jgi:hypothetical protein
MRVSILCCILFCMPTSLVAAEFSLSAQLGKKTLMHEYANWHLLNCSPHPGTVTVVTKPSNGTLTTGTGPYVININRFTGTKSNCAGKRITAFRVYYASKPGFRGTDSFVVNATYRQGLVSEVDRYVVSVR